MDIALTQKFPFIVDKNIAKANCTENSVPVLNPEIQYWYIIILVLVLKILVLVHNI